MRLTKYSGEFNSLMACIWRILADILPFSAHFGKFVRALPVQYRFYWIFQSELIPGRYLENFIPYSLDSG